MIVLDQLLPLNHSLFFHAEPELSLSPFAGTLSIQPSSVRRLPPGTGESFYQAGVRATVVITGYDASFANTHYGSVFSPEVVSEEVEKVASTVLEYVAHQLGVPQPPSINGTYLQGVLNCLAINGTCDVLERVLDYAEGALTKRLDGKPVDKDCGALEVSAGTRCDQ